MTTNLYLLKWKSEIAKNTFKFLLFDRLTIRIDIPTAKGISFGSLSSEDYSEDDDSIIEEQMKKMQSFMSAKNAIEDQEGEEDVDENGLPYEDDEEDIEDGAYSDRDRPWISRLKEISARPRERYIIGEEKIISPTPTQMTEKDYPKILNVKLPVDLPLNPGLLYIPVFEFE